MCKCLKNIKWKNIGLQFWEKIYTSIKFILKFLLICTFIVITYNFAIDKNNTAMIIFAAFSLFFILFFFSSKFEIVELLGAKFKLKELNNSLKELKSLAKISAEAILQLSQLQGRFYIAKLEKDKLKRYNETIKILKELNIPEKEINQLSQEKWHYWVENDYYLKIKELMRTIFINAKEYKELDSKCKYDFDAKYREDNEKSIKYLLILMKEFKIESNDEIKTALDDYKYYIENKEHKDFSRWLKLRGAKE